MIDITKEVRFKVMMDEGDDKLIHKVLELNGDRCLIETVNSGLTIHPTTTVMTDELENI